MRPDHGFNHPTASDITPREVFLARREWLLRSALLGTGLATWAGREALAQTAAPGKLTKLPGGRSAVAGANVMDKPTPYDDVSQYNNY